MSDNVYLGNPNLKKANTPIEFTEDQIREFLRCKDDPVYFANNYVKIVSLDEGLVPFSPYDFQEKLINNFHNNRFNICKMPRQTGKSTTVVSYLLHYALFNDSVNIGILANKASTARELLARLATAYENLPKWMQQGILVWNKGNIELEKNSAVHFNVGVRLRERRGDTPRSPQAQQQDNQNSHRPNLENSLQTQARSHKFTYL